MARLRGGSPWSSVGATNDENVAKAPTSLHSTHGIDLCWPPYRIYRPAHHSLERHGFLEPRGTHQGIGKKHADECTRTCIDQDITTFVGTLHHFGSWLHQPARPRHIQSQRLATITTRGHQTHDVGSGTRTDFAALGDPDGGLAAGDTEAKPTVPCWLSAFTPPHELTN